MNHRWLFTTLLSFTIGLSPSVDAIAAERVVVVVGGEASELERFAADELVTQFERLFDVDMSVAYSIPHDASSIVLIGNPDTNPALPASEWPAITDQGIVLKSTTMGDCPGLMVGGGSPAATLWAVYELGYHFGVRYLLHQDIYPETPIQFELDDLQTVMEPQMRTRTWRTINDFAIGPESWPLIEHQRLLRQLAKMKFNRLMLSVYPWHPFVHYQCRGIKKQTGTLWFGEKFAIARDAPGRTAFAGATVFENSDFAGLNSYEEMIAGGKRHMQGIIAEARRLGMSVGVSISPLEFPREFAEILPGSKTARGINQLLMGPGIGQKFDDPILQELVTAKVRAYLDTYPHLDRLYMTLPEFPEWDECAEDAWQILSTRIGPQAPDLTTLTQQASQRKLIASGQRGVRSLRGNIVALAFLHLLLKDTQLLVRPDGNRVELIITALDPDLYPYADKILPPGSATLNFVDYTARRVAKHQNYLSLLSADHGPRELIMTLADDNVGILSQSTTGRLETLMTVIRQQHWQGFSTRYWMLAELDPAVHYLSRSSWDRSATARSTHQELFAPITGKKSVADRLWLAFGHIEDATELIDQHQLGFAFPVQGMLMKHYRANPAPEWWEKLNQSYTQAMVELYRSHDAAHPRSRQLLFYWAKRSEYVLEYLSCVQSLREAAIAKESGDQDSALEHLETAMEQLYNAIDTLSDIAEDPSDRGLIAVLNAYAYQPLVLEYEAMLSEE